MLSAFDRLDRFGFFGTKDFANLVCLSDRLQQNFPGSRITTDQIHGVRKNTGKIENTLDELMSPGSYFFFPGRPKISQVSWMSRGKHGVFEKMFGAYGGVRIQYRPAGWRRFDRGNHLDNRRANKVAVLSQTGTRHHCNQKAQESITHTISHGTILF